MSGVIRGIEHIQSINAVAVYAVASQTTMLALTAQRGDIAVRSDENKIYTLKQTPASTLANWVHLREPTKQTLTINGRLPSRNEAESAARSHYIIGAKFKREYTDLVHMEALRQHIKAIDGKATIGITFHEKDERRDADNIIGGGIKYILDGLVHAGVIANDTRRYVDLHISPIVTDRQNPRIEISITGVLRNGKK